MDLWYQQIQAGRIRQTTVVNIVWNIPLSALYSLPGTQTHHHASRSLRLYVSSISSLLPLKGRMPAPLHKIGRAVELLIKLVLLLLASSFVIASLLSQTWESKTSKDIAVNPARLNIIHQFFLLTGCSVYHLNILQVGSFKLQILFWVSYNKLTKHHSVGSKQ